MKHKRIITIEQKREIIAHINLKSGTNNGINVKWTVGIYEEGHGIYPKHIYSRSFKTEQEAIIYKNKQEISQKNSKANKK